MKPVTNNTRPVTLMLRSKTAADKKKIAEVEETLSRQVGWSVKLDTIVTAANGDEYRTVGWPMKRGDQAAIQMLLRRGKKPGDPALLASADIHDKRPVDAIADSGMVKKSK